MISFKIRYFINYKNLKMRKQMKNLAMIASCVTLLFPVEINAQKTTQVTVGADVVSGYYWRGEDLGGLSVQPSLSIAKDNFSLSAWGNVGLDENDTKEFDLTAAYTIGKLNIGVTDYSFNKTPGSSVANARYFSYGAHSAVSSHLFEGNIGYNFGPFAINWYTNFAGQDYYKKKDGTRAYSSYVEATAPFTLGGVDMKAEIGCTPWDGAYTTVTDKLAIVNIGVTAKKTVKVTDSFSVPAYAKIAVNPESRKAYMVFGLSF
jgi:hypothetical protein